MNTHNTGPWKYEKATGTIRHAITNHWIATMDSFDGAVNNEANGNLIACAPELFDALRDFYRTGNFDKLNEIAPILIAKAEGK